MYVALIKAWTLPGQVSSQQCSLNRFSYITVPHTYTHTSAHAHTCTPTRSLTHKCTRAKEQITIGLQQWAILTNEKESRKQKKCVWKYPSLSLIGREKVAFWSKLIGAG